jgi:YbbR domain-containing protein
MAETTWGDKFKIGVWLVADTLRRFFLENTLLKVISLMIALFMWYSLSTEEQRSRTLENVPLELRNNRKDTVVTQAPLKVVDLRLRGPHGVILELDPGVVSVSVDVSALEPGNHTIWLSPESVRVPQHVEVLRIDPPSLPVTIERKVTRSVAVEPRVDSTALSPTHLIVKQQVTPAEVQVTGPASKVDSLTEVSTTLIRLPANGSEVTVPAKIELNDQAVTATPTTVTVSFTLDEVGEKYVPGLQLTLPPRVTRISTREVNVTLWGPKSLLSQIGVRDLKASLNVNHLPRGRHEVKPTVIVADAYRDKVIVASTDPEKVILQLR